VIGQTSPERPASAPASRPPPVTRLPGHPLSWSMPRSPYPASTGHSASRSPSTGRSAST